MVFFSRVIDEALAAAGIPRWEPERSDAVRASNGGVLNTDFLVNSRPPYPYWLAYDARGNVVGAVTDTRNGLGQGEVTVISNLPGQQATLRLTAHQIPGQKDDTFFTQLTFDNRVTHIRHYPACAFPIRGGTEPPLTENNALAFPVSSAMHLHNHPGGMHLHCENYSSVPLGVVPDGGSIVHVSASSIIFTVVPEHVRNRSAAPVQVIASSDTVAGTTGMAARVSMNPPANGVRVGGMILGMNVLLAREDGVSPLVRVTPVSTAVPLFTTDGQLNEAAPVQLYSSHLNTLPREEVIPAPAATGPATPGANRR